MAVTFLSITLMCIIYKLNAFFSTEEAIPEDIYRIPSPSPSFIKMALIVFLSLIAIGFVMGYIAYNS